MTRPVPTHLIVLRDGEAEALMREARGPINGRALACRFGPGGVWLDPASRDEHGNYPRWVVLRLAVLRALDLSGETISDEERVELVAFAAAHGREITV